MIITIETPIQLPHLCDFVKDKFGRVDKATSDLLTKAIASDRCLLIAHQRKGDLLGWICAEIVIDPVTESDPAVMIKSWFIDKGDHGSGDCLLSHIRNWARDHNAVRIYILSKTKPDFLKRKYGFRHVESLLTVEV